MPSVVLTDETTTQDGTTQKRVPIQSFSAAPIPEQNQRIKRKTAYMILRMEIFFSKEELGVGALWHPTTENYRERQFFFPRGGCWGFLPSANPQQHLRI